MLPKLQRRVYVGHDNRSNSVKYYNAATRSILTSQNYRFLAPSSPTDPEDIFIKPETPEPMDRPRLEGEDQGKDNHKNNPKIPEHIDQRSNK